MRPDQISKLFTADAEWINAAAITIQSRFNSPVDPSGCEGMVEKERDAVRRAICIQLGAGLAALNADASYAPIPPVIASAIYHWVIYGRRPGSFLCAILENNLQEAVSRADGDNMLWMLAIVQFLNQEVPQPCWGSPFAVAAWAEKRSMENPDHRHFQEWHGDSDWWDQVMAAAIAADTTSSGGAV